jgi:hypothetical protein
MQTFKKTAKQHEAIRLLIGSAMHTMLYGGSRSGKSAILCYALIVRALKTKSRHVIFRQRFKDVKASIALETMPKLLDIAFPGVSPILNRTDWFWTFPNGSEIWLGGLDEKERTEKILGKEYSTVFFNESSQMTWDSVTTAHTRLAESSGLKLKAYYDENPPHKKHWTYKVFVAHKDPDENTPLDVGDYVALRMNPADNEENLPPRYFDTILNRLSKRKRQRFRDGEFQDDEEGALWNANMIGAHRITAAELPELVRIVVGVDPAVTATAHSDETGIIAVGMDAQDHGYVLDDRSLQDKPRAWAEAVVAAYNDNTADRVVGEVNNGGDLVEVNIRTVARNISYAKVHASRGKMIRAEPVSALYELGRMHHVGEFPDLEGEMCGYTGDPNQESPNRMDALVWAVTDLGLTSTVPTVYSTRDDEPPEHVKELEALEAELEEAERELEELD